MRALHEPGKSVGATVVVESRNGLQYFVDTKSFLEWRLFMYGVYEGELQEKMKDCLREGDVAIDCGANVGIHTCVLARGVASNGRVIAVEPMIELADRMKANCDLNGITNVTVLRVAVSSEIGKGILFCPSPEASNRGQASLYRDALHSSVARRIPVTTVDQIVASKGLRAVRLIKIDVEGNELEVLRGAEKTLRTAQPHLFFEYDPENYRAARVNWSELVELIYRLSYRLYLLTVQGNEERLGEDRPSRAAIVIARPFKGNQKMARSGNRKWL